MSKSKKVLHRRRHVRLWMMWPKRMTNHVSALPFGAYPFGTSLGDDDWGASFPLASDSRREVLDQFNAVMEVRGEPWSNDRDAYEPRRTAITYEMLGEEPKV